MNGGLPFLSKSKLQKILITGIWASFVFIFGLGFYVNHYMPHGPMYDTGEVVCQNDDRGPCGPEYVEDVSKSEIPDWAKFLRGSGGELLLIGLAFAGVLISNKDKAD